MTKIIQRPASKRDLVEHYGYLVDNASMNVAERFIKNAEVSFALLSEHLLMGSPLAYAKPEFRAVRKWQVDGFENHLIFYMPYKKDILIIRVLHAAQNWWQLLGVSNNEKRK